MTTPTPSAAELHDVYKAAWAAAPESRPIRGSHALKYLSRQGWSWVAISPLEAFPCSPADAANACRCAAEDWLAHQSGVQTVKVTCLDDLWLVEVEVWVIDGPGLAALAEVHYLGPSAPMRDATADARFEGPTIHHALAAAVVAVAKARSATHPATPA